MNVHSNRSRAGAGALFSLVACLFVAASAFADGQDVPISTTPSGADPWADGSQWLQIRAGYARSAVKNAGNGLGGFGFGYTRFISSKWALGGHVQYDVLGRFGAAQEIDVPVTVEMTRHFAWATPLRPYLGFGTGAFVHKMYRTGADETTIRPGFFFTGGANSPIGPGSLLGADARMVIESDAESDNPVFPSENATVLHWSVKLTYSRFF